MTSNQSMKPTAPFRNTSNVFATAPCVAYLVLVRYMRTLFLAVPFAVAIASVCATQPENLSRRTLTFAQRVSYQRAIEEVYWRHRIWPKENPQPKPSLDVLMSQAQLEKKVAGYLRESQALQDYRQWPITIEQLQAEMDRMAQHSRQPE